MNETQDTRQALIRAARRLFSQNGYEGTSIRAITRMANANLGAITYHFESKEQLYGAVLESFTEQIRSRVHQAEVGSRTPLDAIEAVLRAVFAYWMENPEWPSFVAHELPLSRPIPAPLRRTMQDISGLLSERVRAGQKDHTIVDGDPLLLSISIMSQPIYLALMSRKLREGLDVDFNSPEVRQHLVEHVVSFVRRGLAPSAPGTAPAAPAASDRRARSAPSKSRRARRKA